MITPIQLVNYINIIKAQSKRVIYKGRKTPEYMISGTKDFHDIHTARNELYTLITD